MKKRKILVELWYLKISYNIRKYHLGGATIYELIKKNEN